MADVVDWTEDDYEDAASLYDDPEAGLTEQERSALGKKVVLYQASRRRPDVYRPDGMTALESNMRATGRQVPERPTTTEDIRSGFAEAGKERAKKFAPTIQQPDIPQAGLSGRTADSPDIQAASDRNDRIMGSASGNPEVFAPPEFIAAQPAPQGIMGKIARAWSTLPSHIPGGGVDQFVEPSFEQYIRENREGIAAMSDVEKEALLANRDSDLRFKVWADAKWKSVYDAAKAAGRSVRRTKYASFGREGDSAGVASHLMTSALESALPLSTGALEGLSMGAINEESLSSAIGGESGEAIRSASENAPGSRAVGSFAGSASPVSLTGAAAKAAFQGAERVLPMAPSVLRRLASGGISGGITGAGEAGIRDLSSAATGGELDANRLVTDVGEGGLYGAGFGLGSQAIAEAARGAFSGVREGKLKGPISQFERAGGELRVSGPTPPEAVQEVIRRAEAKGSTGAVVHPLDVALDDIEPAIASGRVKRLPAPAQRALAAERPVEALLDEVSGPMAKKALEIQTGAPPPRRKVPRELERERMTLPPGAADRKTKAFEKALRAEEERIGDDFGPRMNNTLDTFERGPDRPEPVLEKPSKLYEAAPLQQRLKKAQAATEQVELDINPVIDTAIEVLERRSHPGGGDLPFNPSTTEAIRKQVPKMVDIEVIDPTGGTPEGRRVFTFEELKNIGFSEEEIVRAAATKGLVTPSIFRHEGRGGAIDESGTHLLDDIVPTPELVDTLEDLRVVLHPRPVNPRTLDQITDNIDKAAKLTQKTQGAHDEAYDAFSAAIRKVRDTIPYVPRVAGAKDRYEVFHPDGSSTVVTGYSALKAQLDDALTYQRETFRGAGLPEEVPKGKSRPVEGRKKAQRPPPEPALSDDEIRRQRGELERFGERPKISDERTAELGREAGVTEQLEALPVLKKHLKEDQGPIGRRKELLRYEEVPGEEPINDALRKLADAEGVRKELDRLPAIKAYMALVGDEGTESMMRPVIGSTGTAIYSSGLGKKLALRSVPITGTIGGEPGTLLDKSTRTALSNRLGGLTRKSDPKRELAEGISPKLRRLLRAMRAEDGLRKRPRGTMVQIAGFSGGPMGARGETVRQTLTDEDIQNLKRLVEASRSAQEDQ